MDLGQDSPVLCLQTRSAKSADHLPIIMTVVQKKTNSRQHKNKDHHQKKKNAFKQPHFRNEPRHRDAGKILQSFCRQFDAERCVEHHQECRGEILSIRHHGKEKCSGQKLGERDRDDAMANTQSWTWNEKTLATTDGEKDRKFSRG